MSEQQVSAPRIATSADTPALARTLAAAFVSDPLWSWAFPDPNRRPAQLLELWRFYLEGALRYPWTWMLPNAEAVAMWIPPRGTELAPEDEARLEAVVDGLVGSAGPRLLFTVEQFDAAHPRDQPHYYLSLVGTDPAHRGRGLGMGLLTHNLALIDQDEMPAYLESSNPANEARYAKLGFVRTGRFSAGPGGPEVTTMWRAGVTAHESQIEEK